MNMVRTEYHADDCLWKHRALHGSPDGAVKNFQEWLELRGVNLLNFLRSRIITWEVTYVLHLVRAGWSLRNIYLADHLPRSDSGLQ